MKEKSEKKEEKWAKMSAKVRHDKTLTSKNTPLKENHKKSQTILSMIEKKSK